MQTEVAIVVDHDVPTTVDFATHLSNEIDSPTAVRSSSAAVDRILSGSVPPWGEALIVAFDPPSGRVVVLRAADGTVLLRTLDSATAGAPYAVAIVAAELIRYARLPIPEKDAAAVARVWLRPALYLSLGVGVSESFGHEPISFEPTFVVGGELLDPTVAVFSRFALKLRAPVETEIDDLRYRRFGPSVAVAAGWVNGRLRLGGQLEGGVSLTRVVARNAAGEVEGEDSRSPVWVGLGPFAEVLVGAGVYAVFEAALAWSASPADYLVRGAVALAEGRFRWSAALALGWRWQGR